MAGSRAPSGSLRKIAGSVPKAGSRKAGIFGSTPHVPKTKPGTFIGDGSDSDTSSSSDSDSDSDSDSGTKSEPISELQKRISQTPAKTKSKVNSKIATPAKSPTVNGLTAPNKEISSEHKAKEEDSSEEENETSGDEAKDKPNQNDSKNKKKAIKTESSSSDSESDASSGSESESESSEAETSEKTAPKGKASAIKASSTSTSESESDSGESESESEGEEDSDNAAQQIEEQIRNEVNSAKSSTAPSKASEEPSNKGKQSSAPVSEDEDSDVEMMDQSIALTNGGSPTKVGSVPEFIAPDFHLRKLEGTPDALEIANFFSKAQLEGKQVWYITAPASLPVTVMHDLTIPMDEAEKGTPILSHNDEDYRMVFDNPSAATSYRLLVPGKKGDEYSLLNRSVTHSMHITRSETHTPGGPVSVTTTQTITNTKPARPQPEGLRTRYTPLGVPSPKPTITAPASSEKAATSVAPATGLPEASPNKKRKHREDGEDGPIAATFTTPVRKETPSGKKNPTAEKSAKKQKTNRKENQASAPRNQTPVPVPAQINGAYRSSSIPPATQPARSRSSASPGLALPTTQVPIKRSPIPLPAMLKATSSGQLGSPQPSLLVEKRGTQPVKKVKKEKKIKVEDDAETATKTPRKVTQILPPQFDKSGRRIA